MFLLDICSSQDSRSTQTTLKSDVTLLTSGEASDPSMLGYDGGSKNHPSQSITEHFDTCAPHWRTSFKRVTQNAMWSTFTMEERDCAEGTNRWCKVRPLVPLLRIRQVLEQCVRPQEQKLCRLRRQHQRNPQYHLSLHRELSSRLAVPGHA